jgi:hypothetical protein
MATKKDFSKINTGRVYGVIEQATSAAGQQGAATAEERAERASTMKTQGRKGCKLQRINMAFTPENYEFISVMAKLTGKTLTGFCNYAIEKYREQNGDLYEQAKNLINKL